MRVSLMRIIFLFGSMFLTTCVVIFVNYPTSYGTREDERTVDRLRRLNTLEHRILGGRLLQVSQPKGQEYIFSNKTSIDKNITKSISIKGEELPKPHNNIKRIKVNIKGEGPPKPQNNVKSEEAPKLDNSIKYEKAPKHDNSVKHEETSKLENSVKTCKHQRAPDRMENLFGEQFNRSITPFMTLSSLQSASSTRYSLPFGFRRLEGATRSLLEKLPDTDIPADIRKLSCRRCIVIGNGGLMKGAQLGSEIDKYDAVFRLNTAPIKGYETDVGSKTTVRIVYPESSVLSPDVYAQDWTLLVVAFKQVDLQWIDYIIEGRDLKKLKGFWHPTADFVPKPRKDIRIFNPAIISELSANLIGFKIAKGKMDKNVPTTGSMAIMVALRFCDEISVAGFGYDIKRPDTPIHYYSSEKTKSIMSSFTHGIDLEKKFLHKLVKQGIINDLTGGLRNQL
ncbi:lactosylceramide alpha-2,3-sialyltransferase-like [Lytechinus variegatus]|uniref:lactosylceramide alpha-2,3-sialyltransferase-like n=1 Tax=Lytechinus variegatus TaxID=7654 RepID=UPI001BB1B1F0|nr:lactosylceramide alpha-2,3-sialyltransferase-like [Lytechinus variegatus]